MVTRAFNDAKSVVEAAEVSPSGQELAVSLKITLWCGLRAKYCGVIYSINDNAIIGKVSVGRL